LSAASQLLSFAVRPFAKAFGHAKFASLAEQFLTEAAVLVFVFPVLDTIVQFGKEKVTWRLGLGSLAVTIFLLFWAGIIARGRD